MAEQVFNLAQSGGRVVEKILSDENLQYIHMKFDQGDGLPVHFANSNVYMTVIRGTLSIGLNDGEVREYPAGTLLKIPFQTKMNVKNHGGEPLELIVVKSPAPKN